MTVVFYESTRFMFHAQSMNLVDTNAIKFKGSTKSADIRKSSWVKKQILIYETFWRVSLYYFPHARVVRKKEFH